MQGVWENIDKREEFLKEISGMDKFSFQPGGGAQAAYTAGCVVRAYHASKGDKKRTETITTMFSHPCDAAGPATAGFKVVTLMPNEDGYVDLEAFKAALSERTDRKSTRLNSSHSQISYAVFCLKKKKNNYASLVINGIVCDRSH